jgi:parvulin-like peptidyl-prolyl isomerase
VRTAVLSPVVALVLAALLAACGGVGGSVAATVNGVAIDRDLFERMVRAQLSTQGVDPQSLEAEERAERVEPLQQQILTALIQFEILEQLAEEHDVEVSEEQIDEAFDEQVAQFGGEDAYRDETGMTEEEFRDKLVATQVRVDGLIDAFTQDVGEAELREAYEAQVETRYATRSIRHILVDTEEEADGVVDELEDGADFGELAGEVSQDPGSAPHGGEYDHQPRGQYVEEFDEAVWESEIGELVGPVETQFGFHVIEVLEERLEEFEDVRDELEQELTGGEAQQTFQAMVETAFAEAEVEVDSAYGQWDASMGAVTSADRLAPEQFDDAGELPQELLDQFPDGEIPPELLEQFEEFERQLEQQGGAGAP